MIHNHKIITRQLRRLAKYTSKDNFKISLKNVFYDSKEKTLVATDGHYLSTFKTDLGENDLSIPLSDIKKLRMSYGGQDILNKYLDEGKWEKIDHKYPDWRHVWPKTDNLITVFPDWCDMDPILLAVCGLHENNRAEIRLNKEGMTVRAERQFGSGSAEVTSVLNYRIEDGPDEEVVFYVNASLLIDVIRNNGLEKEGLSLVKGCYTGKPMIIGETTLLMPLP